MEQNKMTERSIGKVKINAEGSIGMVNEFMTIFKQSVNNTPIVPSESVAKFRLSLILEETTEIAKDLAASKDFLNLLYKKIKEIEDYLLKLESEGKSEVPNIKGVLDNLVDLRYVADGAALTFGLGEVFDEAFKDVHDANMSKVCINEQEAIDTVEKYKKEGVDTFYEKSDGMFLVYRSSDKKVLKSINWKEADLSKYVQ